jgi:hypothetical protein
VQRQTKGTDRTAAAGERFVGAWRVTLLPAQGTPAPALATLGADGTLAMTTLPVEPFLGADDQMIYVSGGHGAWEAKGPDKARFTFVGLAAGERGTWAATGTISANLTLGADGATVTGSYWASIADNAGREMATEKGTLRAERISVQMPAALASV